MYNDQIQIVGSGREAYVLRSLRRT